MRILASLFLCLALGACGFHLRGAGGTGALSFTQVQIQGDGVVAKSLIDYLVNYAGVELVRKGSAETVINVLSEQISKDVLSIDNSGSVAEYRINYRLRFSATHKGETVLEEGMITAFRTLSWDDNSILSKESEEATLIKDMQRAALQPVLRRVSAVVSKAKQ